jgi:DNA polymerase III epsilon subunit-like protein
MKFILLDTETTNDIDCPLVYDFGFSVIDENANVYESFSFVIADIFLDKELMASAHFADKIPQYWQDIKDGKRILAKFSTVRRILYHTMRSYNTNIIIAHNVRFDYKSSQTTQRYLTKSKWRWFFPYGTEFICTLKMAREIFSQDKNYINFCKENNFTCQNGKPRYTAEILYKYITQDIDFIESHTGLEDVMIEKEIFKECINRGCAVEDGYLW